MSQSPRWPSSGSRSPPCVDWGLARLIGADDSGSLLSPERRFHDSPLLSRSTFDYQDDNGESEAMRAEYYAITRVKSAKRSTTVGSKGGKSKVLFWDMQREADRRAKVNTQDAR